VWTVVHAKKCYNVIVISMSISQKVNVIDLSQGSMLPMQKVWHARNDSAYICWDTLTNSIILASKLTSLAKILNENARNKYEYVKISGLYSAAQSSNAGYTGGLHKMRYGIPRSNLADAHTDAIEKARSIGASEVSVVSEVA
jgi:hypothetical protein